MHVIDWMRHRVHEMVNPRVVDQDERQRFEARERRIRARLEAIRLESEVSTARHNRRWTREQ